MALVDTVWYVNFGNGSSTGYYAVTVRPQNTAVAAGVLRRQFTAPIDGNQRVFVCIVAGTTANVTDATWTLTRGAKTTDGTATWQECTGQAALNGDLTNTATWAQVKAATPAVLGQVIKRSNNASYQICTTAGAMSASEPAFSDTAGVTTTDTTAVWTSLGAVSNFTGGQAPMAHLLLAFASTWYLAGTTNTVYIGDNHAETNGLGFNFNPSSTPMVKILGHNHSGSYPPGNSDLMAGASIQSTNTNITAQGSFYFYGIKFQVPAGFMGIGASSVGQVQNWYYFDNCLIEITDSIAGAAFAVGSSAAASWGIVVFNNTTIKLGGTGQFIRPSFGTFVWQNTGTILAAGSSVPAILLFPEIASGCFTNMVLRDLDLSQLTGSVFSNASRPFIGTLVVQNCKLNATTTVTTPISTGMTVQLAQSASDATSYKSSRHTYEAVETTETSIVRSGGFTDPAGQAQSRKIVTTANTQWLRPYQAQPLSVWNATTGSSVTVTVCGTVNSASLPTNDEIWLEVSGLINASFPVGSVATSGKANVWSAGSAGVSDSSTWSNNFAAWNTSDLTAITLSNSNRTATNTAAGGVRGSWALTGKHYWEFTLGTIAGTFTCVGAAGSTATLSSVASTPSFAVVVYNDGKIYVNGGNTGTSFGARSTNDIIGAAIDVPNKLIWFRVAPSGNWNNSGTANPATGVGGVDYSTGWSPGTMYPLFAAHTTTGQSATANFGSSAFSGSVPSGFSSGLTPVVFKLVAILTPNMAGYLIAQVKVAKASTTFYIDPLAVVT